MLSYTILFSTLAALAAASPVAQETKLGARNWSPRTKTCTVPSQWESSGGTADDSQAIHDAFVECSKNAVVIFEDGVDYNLLRPVLAENLENVEVHVKGNLHLPNSIKAVQDIVNSTSDGTWNGATYWVTLSGENVEYRGTKDSKTGWIKSYGQQWWDANPLNGTGIANRPHLMNFRVNNGLITNLKSHQPIAWGTNLFGRNITVRDTIIDARSNGSVSSFPFNTDGFDIVAQDVLIENSLILNGDDAFAVQSGSQNVVMRGGFLGGPGSHGLSVGSLGQNQGKFANVSDIIFDDFSIHGAVYGARFKSWIGGQGLARNITWSNLRLSNTTYPIFVTQTYFNQGSSQTQIELGKVTGRPNNASVIMEDFTWVNITGGINTAQPGDGSCRSTPCWYDLGISETVDGTQGIIMECSNTTTCTNFKTENIQVFPESDAPTSVICLNVEKDRNPLLGFVCQNGTLTDA